MYFFLDTNLSDNVQLWRIYYYLTNFTKTNLEIQKMLNTILDVDCVPHEMKDLYSIVLMLVVPQKTKKYTL